MPGPSNRKQKQKQKHKKSNVKETRAISAEVAVVAVDEAEAGNDVEVVLQRPVIFDPGNGPRVQDAKMFLNSFFAQPVSVEDELCKEFAQKEILEMLMALLPEETALIVWYNKSRLVSRVCPACQRLYRTGESLQEVDGEWQSVSARQRREQELSGLCSALCFAVALFLYPAAIIGARGHTAEEMKPEVWAALNDGMVGRDGDDRARTLGLVVKMTRLGDLGLGQLLLNLF